MQFTRHPIYPSEPFVVCCSYLQNHVRYPQDMPGWGDDINLMRYLRIVTSFLLEQRAKDYEKLAGSRNLGETAMCGQLQHSITACLYFLPPHRVKKIDLILMAAVSQLVSHKGDGWL